MEDQTKDILLTALEKLKSGLHLLDEVQAPGDIGAHVDLAIERLEAFLAQEGVSHMNAVMGQVAIFG